MKVREAMAKTISTASPQDTLKHVAELMKQEDAGFMPVCENDRVVGVITDRDIVIRCLAEAGNGIANQKVADFMTPSAATISPDADIEEAAQLMQSKEIRRLPVVESGCIVGVLSHGNLVQATHSDGPGDLATLGVTRGA